MEDPDAFTCWWFVDNLLATLSRCQIVEEEEKLKSFVISKDKKIVAFGLNQRIDSHDVTEVAELHIQ